MSNQAERKAVEREAALMLMREIYSDKKGLTEQDIADTFTAYHPTIRRMADFALLREGEMRRERDGWKSEANLCGTTLRNTRAEVERLKLALEQYGYHKNDCPAKAHYSLGCYV